MSALRLCLWLGACLLGACTPAPPIATPSTLWGAQYALAQAPYVFAPQPAEGTTASPFLAWSAPLEGNVRHVVARPPQPATILAMNARAPYDYRALPIGGKFALFWRDISPDTNALTLFASRVSAGLVAELEPIALSGAPTWAYAVARLPDGTLRAVWSAGTLSDARLYSARLDTQARAQYRVPLAVAGEHPSLVQAWDGRMWLYWLSGDSLYRADLRDEGLLDIERLTYRPPLAPTDHLDGMAVAMDGDGRAYAFWRVVAGDGTPSLWLASGGAAHTWGLPSLVRASALEGDVQTGYNSGRVQSARFGGEAIGWGVPLAGQNNVVPMVATQGDALVMLYWQYGEPIGMQTLAQVGRLYSAPSVTADDARHLLVTWAQPTSATQATLFYTSTRR